MKTWKLVAACLLCAAVILLLSVVLFGSFWPGAVLVLSIAVFAGLTVLA